MREEGEIEERENKMWLLLHFHSPMMHLNQDV